MQARTWQKATQHVCVLSSKSPWTVDMPSVRMLTGDIPVRSGNSNDGLQSCWHRHVIPPARDVRPIHRHSARMRQPDRHCLDWRQGREGLRFAIKRCVAPATHFMAGCHSACAEVPEDWREGRGGRACAPVNVRSTLLSRVWPSEACGLRP